MTPTEVQRLIDATMTPLYDLGLPRELCQRIVDAMKRQAKDARCQNVRAAAFHEVLDAWEPSNATDARADFMPQLTTGIKEAGSEIRRPLADAEKLAAGFLSMIPSDCYSRAAIAGSIRRRKPTVKDIELVIEPVRIAETPAGSGGGLFGVVDVKPVWRNLLLQWIDRTLESGLIAKHRHASGQTCWGDLHRMIDFRGITIDMFSADAANWGAILLIRTGPGDFSERVVTKIKRDGRFRQMDGYLVEVATGKVVEAPDEATYLKLAGMPWVAPEDRR